jgi:hypothetical protein
VKREAPTAASVTTACRAAYGAALLAAPVPILTAVTGVVPSARARRVTRLLGARLLAQAAISARAGGELLMLGAVADGLHAVSMLALAAPGHQLRRAELGDALVASLLAAAGLLLLRGMVRPG